MEKVKDMVIPKTKELKEYALDDLKKVKGVERTHKIKEWQEWKKQQVLNDKKEVEKIRIKIFQLKNKDAINKYSKEWMARKKAIMKIGLDDSLTKFEKKEKVNELMEKKIKRVGN